MLVILLHLFVTDFLDMTLPLLSLPLPRVWDGVEGGLAEPVYENIAGESLGGEYDSEAMINAARQFNIRTQMEILRPLQGWMKALELVRVST